MSVYTAFIHIYQVPEIYETTTCKMAYNLSFYGPTNLWNDRLRLSDIFLLLKTVHNKKKKQKKNAFFVPYENCLSQD